MKKEKEDRNKQDRLELNQREFMLNKKLVERVGLQEPSH